MTGDGAGDLGTTATPQEAAARELGTLSADASFRAKLLAGDGPATRQFHELVAAKSGAGTELDRIVDGTAKIPDFDVVVEGNLPIGQQVRAAADLRERGIEPAAIKQLLTGKPPVSKQELELVKNRRADLLADKDFVKALLSGNREALRDLTNANIVIVGGAKEAA